ncbi:uncharacterized protein LOC143571336 [Bidens hawaiensis]|uniref:uncharacterized protein LOC143571336 n=1 Tax=Bidens hawaiensis TaxID=980011 RepID=UPI00404A3E43
MKLGFAQKSYLPASINFANSIHIEGPKEFERGDNNGPVDRESNSGYFGGVTNGSVERENNSGYFGGANNGPVFRENYARSFEGPHQRLAEINRGQLPMQPEFFQNLTRKFADMGKSRDLSETGQDSRPFVRGFDPSQSGLSGRNMNFSGGYMKDNENYRSGVEQNADIVHVKIMRNNTFVTVTDSKGNKKMGSSAGSLAEMKGGPKVSKYSAEATCEHVGREAKRMGLKSVVMKVNGFTFFKKKKLAILSFRDGYTNSRSDKNPIVYLEDTTRKPHNGCRRKKQRRV